VTTEEKDRTPTQFISALTLIAYRACRKNTISLKTLKRFLGKPFKRNSFLSCSLGQVEFKQLLDIMEISLTS